MLGNLLKPFLLLSILIPIFILDEEPEERKNVQDTLVQTKNLKMIADLKEQISSLISLRNSDMSTVKMKIDDVKGALKKADTFGSVK